MNWPIVISNGVKFAIIRSSNGLYKNTTSSDGNGRDKMLIKNASELTTTDIPWAIYHYVQPIHDIEQQIALVVSILDELKSLGTSPRTAQFSDGKFLPRVFLDIEELTITNAQIKFFVDGLADHGIGCGIYTRKNIWEPIVDGVDVWWGDLMLWIAAYGANDGKIPGFTPALPRGWTKAHIWQYTSLGGFEVGHTKDNLDVNLACLHLYTNQPEPPPVPEPPPATKIDVLQYLRGSHRTQFDKEYKLANGITGTQTTQIFWLNPEGTDWLYIKGEQGQYEHLGLRQWNGQEWIFRFEDTSEGPDRWYAHFMNNGESIGAPWLPRFVEVNKWYETQKFVQHYNKDSSGKPLCVKLNSGTVVDRLRVISEPYNRTYPGNKTIQIVTVEWAAGEQYDFAGGNIAFRNSTGDNYWFMQWLYGRADKSHKKPDCINVGW